ncbi:MAG: hypothetical protein AB7I32_12985 [Gammaproteobacteria bacterium]
MHIATLATTATTMSNLNEAMKQMAEIAAQVHGLSAHIAKANGARDTKPDNA